MESTERYRTQWMGSAMQRQDALGAVMRDQLGAEMTWRDAVNHDDAEIL